MDENSLIPKIEEGFLGKTPVDFLNYLFLKQVDDCQRAYMELSSMRAHNVSMSPIKFRTQLRGLYVKSMFGLKRWAEATKPKKGDSTERPDRVTALKKHHQAIIKAEDPSDEELYSAFEFLLEWLDTIRVTRIDTRKKYDRRNWEQDNEASNL